MSWIFICGTLLRDLLCLFGIDIPTPPLPPIHTYFHAHRNCYKCSVAAVAATVFVAVYFYGSPLSTNCTPICWQTLNQFQAATIPLPNYETTLTTMAWSAYSPHFTVKTHTKRNFCFRLNGPHTPRSQRKRKITTFRKANNLKGKLFSQSKLKFEKLNWKLMHLSRTQREREKGRMEFLPSSLDPVSCRRLKLSYLLLSQQFTNKTKQKVWFIYDFSYPLVALVDFCHSECKGWQGKLGGHHSFNFSIVINILIHLSGLGSVAHQLSRRLAP